MSGLRRRVCVVAGAVVTLLALAWMPAAAAAGGQISLLSSGTTADPYVMSVQVNDGNELRLTSMTVHIYSGTTDVYDVTDMAYSSGPASDQVWTAVSPIPQADLPVGSYTTKVDATDADETDSGLTTGQQFSVAYTVTLTGAATPQTVSYGDSTITMSGQVTGVVAFSPYTTPVGLAGVTITLADSYGNPMQTVATTRSDGSYSAQVTLPIPPNLSCGGTCTYYLTAVASSTQNGAEITPPITWARVATRLVSVKVSPEDFIYGSNQQATMTGTAEYDNAATGWQPLANFSVLYVTAGQTLVPVTTDSHGQFTWTYPPSDGTDWSVSVVPGDLLYTSTASGSIHIAVPVKFAHFSASLSPFAVLTVQACLRIGVAAGHAPPTKPLVVQYAARPAGPWKSLGHITYRNVAGLCGVGEAAFQGQLRVALASAYYRAVSPATPDYQAATSNAVRRWKYLTRIISVHVSPVIVRRGGKITVSGRLQTDNGTWRNFAHQQVLIILKPKGSKVWYWIVKVRTNSSGHFTSTFKDPTTAHWSAQYNGNAAHFASIGSVHYVRVSAAAAWRTHRTHRASRETSRTIGLRMSAGRISASVLENYEASAR